MPRFFENIYESILGTVPGETGEYRSYIFPTVGLWTVIITLLLMLIFYYVLNYRSASSTKQTRDWVLILLLNGFSCAGLAWFYASYKGAQQFDYKQNFAMLNFFFSALLFLLSSMVGKLWSPYAKYHPFTWPNK